MSESLSTNSNWSVEQENILIDWADKAQCYRWLHSKSHNQYNFLNACYTIPVIIMSTITGTANFAQDRFSEDIKNIVVMVIGGINLLAGIITTIKQFLKISEYNEAHRVSSISWGKFSRNIKLELSKNPNERLEPTPFIKICKEEYDRLIETSPIISESIIHKFKVKFNDEKEKKCCNLFIKSCCTDSNEVKTSQMVANKLDSEIIDSNKVSKFASLNKPEICDSIESINNTVYGRNKSIELAKFNDKSNASDQLNAIKNKHIREIITQFTETKKRAPVEEEIKRNIDTKIVSKEELSDLLKNIDTEDLYAGLSESNTDKVNSDFMV